MFFAQSGYLVVFSIISSKFGVGSLMWDSTLSSQVTRKVLFKNQKSCTCIFISDNDLPNKELIFPIMILFFAQSRLWNSAVRYLYPWVQSRCSLCRGKILWETPISFEFYWQLRHSLYVRLGEFPTMLLILITYGKNIMKWCMKTLFPAMLWYTKSVTRAVTQENIDMFKLHCSIKHNSHVVCSVN